MAVFFEDLGYDILLFILEQVAVYSRTQLLDCILVNKSWRELAQPILDRKVEFCLGPSSLQNDAKILAKLQDEHFRSNVREFAIGQFYPLDQRSAELDGLAKLIEAMRLRKLFWKRLDSFPSPAWFEAIMGQQDCEVHIRMGTDDDSCRSWTKSAYLGYIASSLFTLEPIASHLVTLKIVSFAPTQQSATALGRLLSKAGRLRSLYINTNQPNVNNWDWLSPVPPEPLNLKQLTLTNFCACGPDTWLKWKNLVSWENLTEVTFTCPSIIQMAGRRLHGLNKLQISAYKFSGALDTDQSHHGKDSIYRMLCMLGTELQELRFCGMLEAFDPNCVSHLRSLKKVLLRNLVYPGERKQVLQVLAEALTLKEVDHRFLKEVIVELPYSPADVHQILQPFQS